MTMNPSLDHDVELGIVRQKLIEAEELINAIRQGAVDGFLANDGQVYTLQSADYIYRVLVDTMNEGAVTLDLNGTILYANRRFCEMMDLPSEALIGESFATFIRDGDHEGFSWLMRRGLRRPSRADFTLMSPNGQELCVLLSVNTLVPFDISAVSVLVTDLTERKRSETQALIRKRLELSQAAGRVGTFDWDMRTGKVVWTKDLEALYGLPENSFEGTYKAWANKVHPEDLPGVEKKIREGIANDGKFHVDFRIIWPDHSVHWLDAKGTTECDSSGTPIRCIGVNIDITERKNLEIRLERSNAELAEYAAVVSHDLQAPLRTISSYLGVLEAKYADLFDDKAKKYFAYIINSTSEMGRLIRGILEYSQAGGEDNGVEDINSSDCLDIALNNLAEEVRACTVIIERDPLPIVRANRVNLTRLFQNLISNAIKYCHQQPRITITVRPLECEWIFAVADNGPGIEAQAIESIFQLFHRLPSKTNAPGCGIGLATCKKIVERHGGRMWVESQIGSGSTFYFTMPKYIGPNHV